MYNVHVRVHPYIFNPSPCNEILRVTFMMNCLKYLTTFQGSMKLISTNPQFTVANRSSQLPDRGMTQWIAFHSHL